MRGVLSLFFVCIIGISWGQYPCGTHATQEQLGFMSSLRLESSKLSRLRFKSSGLVSVPVQFFLIQRSDGSGGLPVSRVQELLTEVNNLYINAQMTFFEVADPILIPDDNFYDLDSSQENDLASGRDKGGVVNIYISGSLSSGSAALCGYTRFPPSTDRVFVALPCADNEVGTTAHELGHYFTLFHTHGKTNNGTTDELADGSNCTFSGDDICDTAADPNLSGAVNGCTYVGTALDGNGQTFSPDPRNIMSYAPNICRNVFSIGQYERIRAGLDNGRSYLNVVFTNFTARFDSDSRSGCSPATFQFTDITDNAISREWTFEGGDIQTSSARVVNVTYETAGKYSVSLTVTNASGESATTDRNDFIVVRDPFENLLQEQSLNGFDVDALPSKWSISNEDKLETFGFAAVSSDGAGNSIVLNNFEYNAEVIPQRDNLILSSFDIRDLKKFDLFFDYAYTFRDNSALELTANQFDSLAIGYVSDCSEDINELLRLGGQELATAPGSASLFIPTSDQWEAYSYSINVEDIPLFNNFQTIRPVLSNISGNGNNLYLDNIQIVPDFSLDSVEFFRGDFENDIVSLRWANLSINSRGVIIERSTDGINFDVLDTVSSALTTYDDQTLEGEFSSVFYRAKNYNNEFQAPYSIVVEIDLLVTGLEDEGQVVIYPNPVNDRLIIDWNEQTLKKVNSIEILSLSGRLAKNISDVENKVVIDVSSLENGIYFVKINTNVKSYYRKLVKRN